MTSYWPFLTGRVRRTGHRVVVAPDLLTVDQARSLLGRLPAPGGGFPSEEGEILQRVMRRSSVGPVTVFYRVVEATAESYGVGGEGALRDQHGRPILLTEGILVSNADAGVSRHSLGAALRQAHALVAPSFRDFWDQDEAFSQVSISSQNFPLPLADDQSISHIVDMSEPDRPTSRPAISDQPGSRRRKLLATLAIALVVLAAGVIGWRSWPHECGGLFSGIRLDNKTDGECIGITDGSYFFNDPGKATNVNDREVIKKINDIQKLITIENGEVAGSDRYVKVVLLMPLTVSQARPSVISLSQILHSLAGSYTALYRANHSDAFGDPSAVKIQLLLANQGSRQDADPDFIDGILKVSQADHPVVTVIGLGASVDNTRPAADHLAKQGIPMVSAVASADNLTMLPLLWSVSPSTSSYSQALKSFLDRQNILKSGVIVHDLNRDVYTQSLALAYHNQLERYVKFPDQIFRGSTVESHAAPDVFYPVVTNLCNAARDSSAPLDMIFYAGRGVDFGAFIEALKARACVQQPLVVLVGENRFTTTEDYRQLLKGGNLSVFYATSSGFSAVGALPGYAAFLKAYHGRGFLDDADLTDGYAIAHHDALATAAQGIHLAAQNGQMHVPNPHDVVSAFGQLDMTHAVPAGSGMLKFRPKGGRADGQLITIQQLK